MICEICETEIEGKVIMDDKEAVTYHVDYFCPNESCDNFNIVLGNSHEEIRDNRMKELNSRIKNVEDTLTAER